MGDLEKGVMTNTVEPIDTVAVRPALWTNHQVPSLAGLVPMLAAPVRDAAGSGLQACARPLNTEATELVCARACSSPDVDPSAMSCMVAMLPILVSLGAFVNCQLRVQTRSCKARVMVVYSEAALLQHHPASILSIEAMPAIFL